MSRIHAYGVVAVFLACLVLAGCAQRPISETECALHYSGWWAQHDCRHAAWLWRVQRDL